MLVFFSPFQSLFWRSRFASSLSHLQTLSRLPVLTKSNSKMKPSNLLKTTTQDWNTYGHNKMLCHNGVSITLYCLPWQVTGIFINVTNFHHSQRIVSAGAWSWVIIWRQLHTFRHSGWLRGNQRNGIEWYKGSEIHLKGLKDKGSNSWVEIVKEMILIIIQFCLE